MINKIIYVEEALKENTITIDQIEKMLLNKELSSNDILNLQICSHCKIKILLNYYDSLKRKCENLLNNLENIDIK